MVLSYRTPIHIASILSTIGAGLFLKKDGGCHSMGVRFRGDYVEIPCDDGSTKHVLRRVEDRRAKIRTLLYSIV
jgi:hypothetical protein